MRPFSLGDLTAAARVLWCVPETQRSALLHTLFAAADEADAHRLKTGRLHSHFGNGSLSAVAHGHPMADRVDFSDRSYCRCLVQVLEAYLTRAPLSACARDALRGSRVEF